MGAQFYANAGRIVNLNDIFVATERKKRNADIILLEKQKKQYDNYVALADKVKDLIAQKHDKGIDVYMHESFNNRGVIKNEELKILIEDHTGENPQFKRE